MEATWEGKTKADWRRTMGASRDAVPVEERNRMSERLCGHVEREILSPMRSRLGRPLTVFVYAAFRSEADPRPLIRACWEQGDTVAAPRIEGSGMEWRIVRREEDWRAGKWGIPEPDPAAAEELGSERTPDAVLVPGLAFDLQGGRLGYGGGYYDRMYAAERTRGNSDIRWIGFAMSPQIVRAPLPKEPHDLALDAVATDEGIYWLTGEGK